MFEALTRGELEFEARPERITRLMRSEGDTITKNKFPNRLPRTLGMMYFSAKLKLYWADQNLDPDRFEVREVFNLIRGVVQDWIDDSPARRKRERLEARLAKVA